MFDKKNSWGIVYQKTLQNVRTLHNPKGFILKKNPLFVHKVKETLSMEVL